MTANTERHLLAGDQRWPRTSGGRLRFVHAVYLIKLEESLDTMFRLQDTKVKLKTAMTGRQPVEVFVTARK